jgi:hypothetical protein
MQFSLRTVFKIGFVILLIAMRQVLFGQGFVTYAPLSGSTAYQITEQPGSILKVFGNHNNFQFNAQATLSNFLLTPQGIYLGIGDSLQNTNTNDYWLWLPNAEHLVTFRTLSSTSELRIERFRPDSSLVYDRTLALPGADSIYFGNVKELANGDLFAFGLVDTAASIYSPEMMLLRINSLGDTVWTKTLPILPGQDIGVEAFQSEITELANDDIVIVLMADGKPLIVRVKSNGELVYRRLYPTIQIAANPAAAIAPDGTMFISIDDAPSGALFMFGLNANADIIWQKDLRSVFTAETDLPGAYQILINTLGNPVFAGSMLVDGIDRQLVFGEFNKLNGNTIRTSSYAGFTTEAVRLIGSLQRASGDYVFCGKYLDRAVVLQTNVSGQIFDGYLAGRVAIDINNDCLAATTEPTIKSWLVEAKGAANTYYTYTDTSGFFAFDNLDSSQYTIRLKQQNYTWQSCPDSVVVLVAHDSVTTAIAAKSIFDCAVMKLDIAAPFIRYCATNFWHINYRNYGSDTAKNVQITIDLDPNTTFDAAEITPTSITGKRLVFDLPDVQASEGGTFWISANMDCAAVSPGRSLCVSGHITPDSLCVSNLGNWNGGMLEATPSCTNDTVRFELMNKGKNPTGTLDYIIIEDHIFLRTEPVNLNPGETKIISQFAQNNGTVRLISNQVTAHPLADIPSVAVEGCGPTNLFSIGYLTELPNQTGNPFTDIFCDEIIASLDPNDKRAFPKGFDSQHIIGQNVPLEYIVRFQNTGNDTAFRVVIIDTLSQFLDISTVLPGASSHRYSYTPSANNTLVFTFDPIALPDSNVNQVGSNGFVQFRVSQKPNVAKGSIIENQAAIYFDFNQAVQTNQTIHVVEDIQLADHGVPDPTSIGQISLSPNPAKEICSVEWKGSKLQNPQIVLTNAIGQRVYQAEMRHSTQSMKLSHLPSGIYLVQILESGIQIASSKLNLFR